MKKLLAESVGTFALVLAGTGAIVVDGMTGGAVTHLGVALTFGLIVLAMIRAFGDVSGAHLNPAVTLGFVAASRFPLRMAIPYVAAQCLGAIVASVVLAALFPGEATLGATLPAGGVPQAFALELAMTWLLMFAILSLSAGSKESGPIVAVAIGTIVGLEAFFGGPISGASMNPARSLAPAIVSGRLENLWIYLAAPILGALLAVPCCRRVHARGCCNEARGIH